MNDLKEQCTQLAEMLGLNEPISEDVLKAALQDETYATKLFSSKDLPGVLVSCQSWIDG